MSIPRTENPTGPVGYGNCFCTKPYHTIDRNLLQVLKACPRLPNPALPMYEVFAPHFIWYNIMNNRWPHLNASEKTEEETAGLLVLDWTKEYEILGSRFDLGPFEVFAGLRIPMATCRTMKHDLHDEVFVGLFTEDHQAAVDIMNDESMEYLARFFHLFKEMPFHLNFESDPFFYSEVDHTRGLFLYCRLLDHLETLYSCNSPESLTADEP